MASELTIADPERWAAQIPYAQIVDWVAFYKQKFQLQNQARG